MKIFKTHWQSLPLNFRTTFTVILVVLLAALMLWGMTSAIEFAVYFVKQLIEGGF